MTNGNTFYQGIFICIYRYCCPVFPKLAPPDTNGIGLQNLRNRFELMMKKEIRVETDGDTFCIYLPLKDGAAQRDGAGRPDEYKEFSGRIGT